MHNLRIVILQWAAGIFLAIVGALMLVAPHQFRSSTYLFIRPNLPWWGGLFLFAGCFLITVAALAPQRSISMVAHIVVGGALLLLASGFFTVSAWSGFVTYSVLGTAVLLSILALPSRTFPPDVKQTAAFALAMSVLAILNGALLLLFPGQYTAQIYANAAPYLQWMGAALLVGGVLLGLCQLPGRLPNAAVWLFHLLAAAALWLFCVMVSLPARAWTGILLYGGFGMVVALLPWLGARIHQLDTRSLRLRLALLLAAATALPMIGVAAIVGSQQERLATTQALELQQRLAETLAADTNEYIVLHIAAAQAIATQPGLVGMSVEQQTQLLRRFNTAFPDLFVFSTWDVAGNALARSDDLPLTPSVAGLPTFRQIQLTGSPVAEFHISRSTGRPVIAFGVPIHDQAGQFAGIISGAIDGTRISEMLTEPGELGLNNYLVDNNGTLIAHRGTTTKDGANWSQLPPVVRMLAGTTAAGSMTYATSIGEQLAGYARLSGVSGGIIVERPTAAVLDQIWADRDQVFAVLLLVIVAAAALGVLAARYLTNPLAELGHATERLAAGDNAAPLPDSQVTETARLAAAFGQLRHNLQARTAERDRAEASLRFLATASDTLARSLDYETTLAQVAQLAVTSLADVCVIDLKRADSVVERVAAVHADPSKAHYAEALRAFPPDLAREHGIPQVFRSGVPLLLTINDQETFEKFAQNSQHLAVMRAIDTRVFMIVPLRVGDQIAGTITLIRSGANQPYLADDLNLASELARRAAVAVENAQLYRTAQEAIQARDVFLTVAAHELKTPLTSLIGFAEILQRRSGEEPLLSARERRAIQTVYQMSERLNELVSTLLDVSRIQSGQLVMEHSRVELYALVAQVIAETRPALERHTLDLSGDQGPFYVHGAAYRLEQVVQNLVQNALKYSPEGGRVDVCLLRRDNFVEMIVRDQGIGIPSAAQAHLFERFYRASNVRAEQISGLGIGLYIVREIITQHGGTIVVESTEGVGSTFTVSLPLAPLLNEH